MNTKVDYTSLIHKLHPLERKVLPSLTAHTELSKIIQATNLQEIEVMRALQWLENKKLLHIHTTKQPQIILEKNGLHYKQHGLPETAFLNVLTTEFQPLSIIAKKASLSTEETTACIGLLRKKTAIELQKDKELAIKLTPIGKNLQHQPSLEETFLTHTFPLPISQLTSSDPIILEDLKRRKDFITIQETKTISITLTEQGTQLITNHTSAIQKEVINRLTKEMLKTGSWTSQDFRSYDVEINVPKIHPGRKHFDNQALEYIKRIWLDLGFTEMTGNYVQSAFWDLDALFVPQDHPAREMQDTFYLDGKAKLPLSLLPKIKAAHENGANTGSTGWQYSFSTQESEKILLRTHTTVLSAQTLNALKKEDLPAKFFAVGKVFRNEALDWKHLFEFYQVEGIVINPNANLTHLKGYLREFYKKMGYDKIRMRPAHFPYTEPSLEVDIFHPIKKQWVELGGAGIFRPEVVKPLLGFDCPVLAWGQGMGRIITEYWNISDIRDLYKNDMQQLREIKTWIK